VAMFQCRNRLTGDEMAHSFNSAMATSGMILLLNGLGGAIGGVLTAAGVGDALNEMMTLVHLPVLLFIWFTAAMIRLAQGSGIVAMITASGIVAAMGGNLGVNMTMAALAAGYGAMFAGHLNDSGYWVITNVGGLTVEGGLKTYTVYTAILSVVGLILISVLSLFVR